MDYGKIVGGVVVSLSLTTGAFGGKVVDKSSYHLFNPVPKDLMKDMSADRPDKTEGPYVIDPGHFQFEFGLADYTWDHQKSHGDNQKVRTLAIFETAIRIGLMNKLELEVLMDGFNRVRTYDYQSLTKSRQSGYGDTSLRFKYNFWGNEGECKTAFGFIPFVKFATNQHHLGNRSIEQGYSFPFDVKVTDKMNLSFTAQVNVSKGHGRGKRVAEFIQSAEVAYQFSEKLSGYAEIFTDKSTDGGTKWIVTGDYGLNYALSDNLIIDAGMSVGLSKEADDMNVTMGISVRI